MYLLADLLFIIGSIFFFFSFKEKSKNKTLIFQFVSILFFNFGLYLYNVVEASLFVSLISLFSLTLGLFAKEKPKRIITILTPFIAILSILFLDYDIGTFLTILGTMFSAIAALSKDIFKMKLFYLFSNITWLFFDIYIQSIGAIIFDLVGMIALYIFFKNYLQEKKL